MAIDIMCRDTKSY